MADAVQESGHRLRALSSLVSRRLEDDPYPVLALAAVAGYVAGGGLFSRLTRPLARAAMGALLVPGFRERILGLARDVESRASASASA